MGSVHSVQHLHPTQMLVNVHSAPPTRTHTHSIIKPVSKPHRKQSLLYVTGMSLILAEVNKCSCMEGIFHRQAADNRAIVASAGVRPGPSAWLWIHGSCQGLCFISQTNVFVCKETCETRRRVDVPAVYLCLLRETTIYFSERGGSKCVWPFFRVWPRRY